MARAARPKKPHKNLGAYLQVPNILKVFPQPVSPKRLKPHGTRGGNVSNAPKIEVRHSSPTAILRAERDLEATAQYVSERFLSL